MRRAFLLFMFALSLVACGRKGEPRPPEVLAPSPVRFLSAAGEIDGIKLSWFAPTTDASGDGLIDLTYFLVEKGESKPGESTDFEFLKKIEVVGEPAENQQYSFIDADVQPGKIYDYRVTANNNRGGQGLPPHILRVTFVGQSSVVEAR